MIYIAHKTAINFRHSNTMHSFLDTNKTDWVEMPCRATSCEIVELDIDGNVSKVISRGYAVCHPTDNFSKESGRKLSLTRAVNGLNRADRKRIWNAYFTR